MSLFVPAEKWASDNFDPRIYMPTEAEIIDWIQSREIPGRVIKGKPFVDAEAFALGRPVAVEPLSGVDLLA